jgi:hypothetical protein
MVQGSQLGEFQMPHDKTTVCFSMTSPLRSRRHTWAVTAYSFPETGVVRGTVVATGLTRREVAARFPDCQFRDPMKVREDDPIPAFAADPEWTNPRPTASDVRKLYEDQGCEVRIDREGHVEFRREGETIWLEGRWVSEYRFIHGQVALV